MNATRKDDALRTESIREGDPAGVRPAEEDGQYVACCELCDYVGVPMDHNRARAAARQHLYGNRHRRKLTGRALRKA